MADFGAIFTIIARSSSLALWLYNSSVNAPRGPHSDELCRTAQSMSGFASAVKHVGTVIKEDDTLMASRAVETLTDAIDQSNAVLDEVETIAFDEYDNTQTSTHFEGDHDTSFRAAELERLIYLRAHLDCLRATISALQQTLYTAQSIIWARVRPAVSPQQAAAAVANEKTQLQITFIEQQILILLASRCFEHSRTDAKLLMEKDSTMSLITREKGAPKPGDLHRYQEESLAGINVSETCQEEWFTTVCGISESQVERLLAQWTRLDQVQETITSEERKDETQRRENQQATVESDCEEDASLPEVKRSCANLATPTPLRPQSVQPLFTDATLPIPVPISDMKYGPTAPLSPVSSYGVSPRSPAYTFDSTTSPRTSISSLPMEAAAAVEAKDKDEEVDLEIPWTLCTRKYYWKFIDNKLKDSNTDRPSSESFANRNSWTEILASWVCKEAIQEQEYDYTQVQKERRQGRRTRLETCFCIQQPLTFAQVQRLVERTVEIFRAKQPPTPPPPSSQRPAPRDRHEQDRTPLAIPSQAVPPTYTHLPPPSRTLERTVSHPGPAPPHLSIPTANPQYPHYPPSIPRTLPTGQSPISYFPPPPAHPNTQSPASYFPPPPPTSPYSPHLNPTFNPAIPHLHHHPPANHAPLNLNYPPPPHHHRPRRSKSRHNYYSDTSTATDSDSAARRRRHRSRSRRSSTASQKKNGFRTVGTLAKAGGLAALLDGIVDLGVL